MRPSPMSNRTNPMWDPNRVIIFDTTMRDGEQSPGASMNLKNATVCGLARASKLDIDRCAEAVRPAARSRIHTFISTSPLHMKYKLQMEPEAVYQAVIDSVTRARTHTDDVEWSAEDGS